MQPLVKIDFERHEVEAFQAGGKWKTVRLTDKEFRLLVLLAREDGKIISRNEALRQVWRLTDPASIDTRTIDQHLARLRKALGKIARQSVVTVACHGYKASRVQFLDSHDIVVKVEAVTDIFKNKVPFQVVTLMVPRSALSIRPRQMIKVSAQ